MSLLLTGVGGKWSKAAAGPPAGGSHWYRKNVGITESSGAGTGVSQWDDQIGTDHIVQATLALRPALQGGGTILFNGLTQFLRVTFAAAMSNPITCGIRFKPPSSYAINAAHCDGAVLNTLRISNTDTSPQLQLYTNTGSPPLDTTHFTLNAWNSVVGVKDPTSSNAAIVVAVLANRVQGTSTSGTLTGLTFGASGATTENPSAIEMAEFIIYPSSLSDSDITSLLAYLDTL